MVPGIILMVALLFVFCREFIHPRIHPFFTAGENLNYAPPLYVHHAQIRNNREEKIDLPPDYSTINEYEKIDSPEFTATLNDLPPPYFQSYNFHQ